MYPGCQSNPSHRQASPHTGSRDPSSEVIIDRVLQQVDEGTKKARHSAGKAEKGKTTRKRGTPGAADPNPKVPPPVGKTGGANPPPKGKKKAPLRRSVRFQNQKEKGKPRPVTPPTTKKDTVHEAPEVEDLSNTDCDTEELADLPTDSEPEGTTGETSGEEQVLEGGPQ